MHELALSQELFTIVARAAQGRTVRTVELQIGAFRQVVPAALEYAWSFVVANTALAGAQLKIEEVPAVIACDEGHVQELHSLANGLNCPKCGRNTRIVKGEEFTVVALDLES